MVFEGKIMSQIVKNIVMSTILVLVWIFILFMFFILTIMNDIISYFCGGIFKYVFAAVFLSGLLVPVIFRKRIKKYCSLPLALIIFAVFSALVNCFMYLGIKGYISDFSREKWDLYEKLRIHMIGDFENENELKGKSEEEIKDLLGEPANIVYDKDAFRYEYYIGDGLIDPYTYDIIFYGDSVSSTEINEH